MSRGLGCSYGQELALLPHVVGRGDRSRLRENRRGDGEVGELEEAAEEVVPEVEARATRLRRAGAAVAPRALRFAAASAITATPMSMWTSAGSAGESGGRIVRNAKNDSHTMP